MAANFHADSDSQKAALMSMPQHFDRKKIFLLAGGHFINDSYTGYLAPLLPLIGFAWGGGRAAVGAARSGGREIRFGIDIDLVNPFYLTGCRRSLFAFRCDGKNEYYNSSITANKRLTIHEYNEQNSQELASD